MGATDALQIVENAVRPTLENDLRQVGAELQKDVQNLLARSCATLQHTTDTLKVSEWIDSASDSPSGRREAALLFLRYLEQIEHFAEADGEVAAVHRRLVSLVETAAPDISEHLKLSQKKQNHEKFEALRAFHPQVCETLSVFRKLPSDSREFAARRQEIFKILNNKILKAYLNPFDFPDFANAVRLVYGNIHELLELRDATFGEKLQQTFDFVDAETARSEQKADFLSIDYYLPFLKTARLVLERIEKDSSERFKCTLRLRRDSPYVLERKYPLHEENRILRVKIPLVNTGPGVAIGATAQIVSGTDRIAVAGESIDLGTVPPGESSILCEVLVGDHVEKIPLLVELSWGSVRGAERQTASFDLIVLGQKTDIDWEFLEHADPYSTEPAQGDEFVGRRAKVLALLNRLRKERMQSSYITGQKRVGKTSLAFAVKDQVMALSGSDKTIVPIYLEYGEYAHRSADATLDALGIAIATHLLEHFPSEGRPAVPNFNGSLAPLNQISQALITVRPELKFLVILDEFDEIHPEMYRFGSLAETFFSNLRTLSAKQNIALMLVGGENMPFIIGAQGDQLNKFVRERLDYFSRAEEWEDFSSLVREKGESPLSWHDAAISEIFNYTNGHPYYTKLLCARIFQTSVAHRDADVTVDEVQAGVAGLVGSLDTNAFAHFWKDGIPAGREEAEVVELKRCRVLVALARTRRQGQPLNVDTISANRGGSGLSTMDIGPILADFCRRDILREKGTEYEFVLPLFEEWLVAGGLTKLITDTLGDEMADAIQQAEDRAYVSGPEISALADRWPLYRGRRVTAEDIRNWLNQVPSFQEQRLLFKLLQNVRFLSEEELREKLRSAHSIVKNHTTPFTPESRVQRRYDIMVTWVDGPGKSGSRYADRYAEENLISTQCVVAAEDFAARVLDHEDKRGITVNGVVIIDDIVATGRSLADNVERFVTANLQFLLDRNITVVIVGLLATRDGEEKLRAKLQRLSGVNLDFRACEVLADMHYAFCTRNSIWADGAEADQARALVTDLGQKIYKTDPLGFGGLGLLVVFSDTCPNNTLPILHGSCGTWEPLFPRPKN